MKFRVTLDVDCNESDNPHFIFHLIQHYFNSNANTQHEVYSANETEEELKLGEISYSVDLMEMIG